MRSMTRAALAALGLSILPASLLAETAAPFPGTPRAPDVGAFHTYFPNFDGTVWTFVDYADHETTVQVTSELLRRGGGRVDFRLHVGDSGWADTFRYGEEGMQLRGHDGPAAGALDWSDDPPRFSMGEDALPGHTYRARPAAGLGDGHAPVEWVVEVDEPRDILVRAGHFRRCLVLRVRHLDQGSDREVSNLRVFLAPGVGPVLLEGHLGERPVRLGLASVSERWGMGVE